MRIEGTARQTSGGPVSKVVYHFDPILQFLDQSRASLTAVALAASICKVGHILLFEIQNNSILTSMVILHDCIVFIKVGTARNRYNITKMDRAVYLDAWPLSDILNSHVGVTSQATSRLEWLNFRYLAIILPLCRGLAVTMPLCRGPAVITPSLFGNSVRTLGRFVNLH